MFETIVRDGVVLKPLETWHAGEFAEHMSRARDHIRPWVGPTFVTDTVVVQRLRMRSDGVLRSSCVYDHRRYDKEVFSILRAEWMNTRPGVVQ